MPAPPNAVGYAQNIQLRGRYPQERDVRPIAVLNESLQEWRECAAGESCFKSKIRSLISQLIEALQHDSSGLKRHGLHIELTETASDGIGVDKFSYMKPVAQDTRCRSSLTGSIGSSEYNHQRLSVSQL